jgi:hypothetical protein
LVHFAPADRRGPLKDMAASSAELIAWVSGDDLARRGGCDRTYIMAAVLYYGLVGELYPVELSHMRRLQRQIAYRAGNIAALRATLDAAISKNLAMSARRLGDFIVESLGPSFGRPTTVQQAHATLERLERELSAALLAGGWETTGRADLALAILESHARLAPADVVPWQTLARLRRNQGRPADESGPMTGRTPPPSWKTDTLIGRIRAIVVMGPDGLSSLASTLNDIIRPGAPELADDDRLFVAYATARWHGSAQNAITLLARPCKATWDRAVLLLAWLHSEQQAWAQVASDCRECVATIGGMPAQGGERGAYAAAFALMLDAGAHIAFVAAGHSADYLEDAWKKLDRARALLEAERDVARRGARPTDQCAPRPVNACAPPELPSRQSRRRAHSVSRDCGR